MRICTETTRHSAGNTTHVQRQIRTLNAPFLLKLAHRALDFANILDTIVIEAAPVARETAICMFKVPSPVFVVGTRRPH